MDSELGQIPLTTIDGRACSLAGFAGKVLLIVNTASRCGFTPQYAGLEALHRQFGPRGFAVLGFPCNDFGGQEPGSAGETQSFCQKNYGVTFPMFEKVQVKGDQKSPVYQWLTDPAQNGWNSEEPSWNFCKYLLDENGHLTHYFKSGVKPSSEAFLEAMGM